MSPKEDWTSRQRNQLQSTKPQNLQDAKPQKPPDNRQQKHQGKKGERREQGREPRSRECLLKGCGEWYRPKHPMARYCSEECRVKARKWSQWKSRRRWRGTEIGREKRKQQTARHRERVRVEGRASTSRGREDVRGGPKEVAGGREEAGRGSSQRGLGKNFFQRQHVIVLDATRALNERGVRHYSGSAVTSVGVH